MRRATIKDLDVCDRLAKFYAGKLLGGTTIEAIVCTSANVGDRVRLPELQAERNVTRSQWVNSVKVCAFTAWEWLCLRHLEECPPDVLSDAREVPPLITTATAATRSKQETSCGIAKCSR